MGVSRRKVLAASGAAGAVGAVSLATPAQAKSLWTWSAKGSVAGTGAGTDPRYQWDEEADPVVARVIERGQVAQANAALRRWMKNGQSLPDGLPSELRDFMERARRLPSWFDDAKIADGFDFNERRGIYLGVLYGLNSGMMSTAIPKEARAVYYSQGGADMKDRISKTAKLGYDIMSENPYGPDGEMTVTCVKTRIIHAAIRHLLPQSPHWTKVAPEDIPISQRDIMVTWHSLPTSVMRKLDEWRVPLRDELSAGYLHSWQVAAHMLGVHDEYIPASWGEAESQARQVLDPLIAATPEGIELARILLNLAAEIDGGVLSTPMLEAFTRYMLGEEISDLLQIQRRPVLEATIRTAWPPFIAVREGLLPFPYAPELYWVFEEFIRRFTLFYLSEGRPISIEIPETNNPNYP